MNRREEGEEYKCGKQDCIIKHASEYVVPFRFIVYAIKGVKIYYKTRVLLEINVLCFFLNIFRLL